MRRKVYRLAYQERDDWLIGRPSPCSSISLTATTVAQSRWSVQEWRGRERAVISLRRVNSLFHSMSLFSLSRLFAFSLVRSLASSVLLSLAICPLQADTTVLAATRCMWYDAPAVDDNALSRRRSPSRRLQPWKNLGTHRFAKQNNKFQRRQPPTRESRFELSSIEFIELSSSWI